ncbi:MAG: aldehyde dehydrogenase family protein [Merismopedia sp. SIO2A8]|nr:aldehyde dehydrogenase family protein [Merismopedia sp. SIO2A8]
MNSSFSLEKIAQQAQQASHTLVSMGAEGRSHLLQQFSCLIEKHQDDILEANTLDLEASREMAVPDIMLDWLRLTPERIQATAQLLEGLAQSFDPLEQVGNPTYPIHGAQSYSQRLPLGVIGLVYESLPQLGAIAAGLCIRSGNALI